MAPDAPGRDQLVAIVDVDNPNATTTAPPTTSPPTTSVAAPSTTAVDAGPDDAAGAGSGDDSDDSSSGALPIAFGAVAVVAAGGAFVLWRQRRG